MKLIAFALLRKGGSFPSRDAGSREAKMARSLDDLIMLTKLFGRYLNSEKTRKPEALPFQDGNLTACLLWYAIFGTLIDEGDA